MNSKLFKKKSAFIFLTVFAVLIVGCVFLNVFLVRPAVAKSSKDKVDSSATDEVTQDEPEIERKKTDDGFTYYILTDDNKNAYVTITSYDGDEKNVLIPNSIENYPVKEIADNCFTNINKVESITIPDSVVTIGDFAFFGCPNLTKVVIPNSVKKIGAAINAGSHFTIYGEPGSYAEEYTLHPEKHTCTEPIPFEPINSKD